MQQAGRRGLFGESVACHLIAHAFNKSDLSVRCIDNLGKRQYQLNTASHSLATSEKILWYMRYLRTASLLMLILGGGEG